MVGYALFYFVRKNFSFAIPGLSAEYGITKTRFGIIMTLVTMVYGVSRFLNGLVADRINARYHMAIGLFLCAVANYAFGFGADLSALLTGETSGAQFTNTMVLIFGIILVLNNFLQGSGFPPCARLLTHWIPQQELATKMSVWNTSHSIGASIVAILCGYIMGTLGTNMAANPEMVASIAAHLNIDASDTERMQGVLESAAHVGAWRWCFWIPAIIALCGDDFAGFTYIESWGNRQYVATSGLIVHPKYRGVGLARRIKHASFTLARLRWPNAKIFSLTSGAAVMKMNTELGYVPVTFNELTDDEAFWKGCEGCINHGILKEKNRKFCICTAMLYDPALHKDDKVNNF